MTTSSPWPPGRRARAVTAVVLGLAGVLLLWAAVVVRPTPDAVPLAGPGDASVTAATPSSLSSTPSPTTRRTTASANRSTIRDRTNGLVLAESHPVSVAIPAIGVRSRLVDLGLDADGAMEVPRDPSLAGWFTGSPSPGALGPAVIAGHVTWNRAPAVFRHLGRLHPGDRVEVVRKDGRTAVFTVDRVARYAKSRFPTEAVYGTIDHAGLRLITCGGTYDTAQHRYLDNVVVFGRLTTVRGPRG